MLPGGPFGSNWHLVAGNGCPPLQHECSGGSEHGASVRALPRSAPDSPRSAPDSARSAPDSCRSAPDSSRSVPGSSRRPQRPQSHLSTRIVCEPGASWGGGAGRFSFPRHGYRVTEYLRNTSGIPLKPFWEPGGFRGAQGPRAPQGVRQGPRVPRAPQGIRQGPRALGPRAPQAVCQGVCQAPRGPSGDPGGPGPQWPHRGHGDTRARGRRGSQGVRQGPRASGAPGPVRGLVRCPGHQGPQGPSGICQGPGARGPQGIHAQRFQKGPPRAPLWNAPPEYPSGIPFRTT